MQKIELLNVSEIRFGPSHKPAGRPDPKTHQLLFPHAHPNYHQLLYIRKGRLEQFMSGAGIQPFDEETMVNTQHEAQTATMAAEGHILINPRGIVHQIRSLNVDVDSIWVFWSESPRLREFSYPVHSFDPEGGVRPLLEEMLDHWPPQSPSVQRELQRIFTKALQLLRPFGSIDLSGMDSVQRVKNYIRNHLTLPVCLNDLSKIAGASPYHFSRQFTAATGMSPMRYVRQSRVEAAQTLLRSSSEPLSLIAPRVGFRDEYQMSHVFAKATGISPGTYRKQFSGRRSK